MYARAVLVALPLLLTGASLPAVSGSSAPVRGVTLRVTSAIPGRQVPLRGVVLIAGEPMRLVEQPTPFELKADARVALAAFEPQDSADTLTLEMHSGTPASAKVTAHRVMMGHQIGGAATDFVQGY
jgi:hypothetical protein